MSVHRPAFLLRCLAGAALATGLLLEGCANVPEVAPAQARALLDDALFKPPLEPVDPADVFRMSASMQEYLEQQIVPAARGANNLRSALTDQLYNRSKLKLEYESSMTRNAAQAFDARSGNCLSLVIMTAAFAKALGLQVTYQSIGVDEMWTRSGDMYFLSGHVNLQLERRASEMASQYDRFSTYTIDFLPEGDSTGMKATIIPEKRVLAMYMNNRAAEALARGQMDDAYWRVKQALALDPAFLSALNTLGVVYAHHGDAQRAVQVFAWLDERSPNSPRVMSNYAAALRAAGQPVQAQAVQQRLAVLEPYPPFYFFNRGRAALGAGNVIEAREWFKRELDRSPDYHEFHYWLALADFGLGRIDEARSELKIAMDDAGRRTDHDLYAAKLDKLKAYLQAPVMPSVTQ
ncbi:MAG TPA: tetratricopeptide repeat protein [Burkholderiaceae bacterium]|jgi:Tfp pilus assembly protein PilF|nr:tetratricopeptide repeat protein [Burkholderiaceae bacterium]